jgi:uncharacterized protein YjbI with pentapeptide repeats
MRIFKIKKFKDWIKRKISNIKPALVEHSDILAAGGIFLIILVIISILNMTGVIAYRGSFLENFLGEVHGLAFDVLVFGILIVLINKRLERRRDIKRWREEIDNFRRWDEKEATFRIAGNIRRLNKLGITDIDLSGCFLWGAELSGAKLQRAFLERTNLQEASLWRANLLGADLHRANLRHASLAEANLGRAIFMEANLEEASLRSANLWYATFWGAILKEASLRGAILKGANLQEANLQKAFLLRANLQEADITRAINLTIEQLAKVRTLYKAKLDPDLEKEVREKYPHLLEKPKEEEEEGPEGPDWAGR